ncbi:unnamed protein product [Strongylus vulgaris]|uniref:SWIM-type domain-containing protein n=1 Tax=Strongylus vulgaris TaxID=40348 RepID=A0A3P7KRS8_STRVU|nr:unnamed protein product [Strongylus vulgaris]
MQYYGAKPEKVCRIGDNEWQVEGKHEEELYFVTLQASCTCDISLSGNVHCPLCSVCPYSWNCTCLDNRAGISCFHKHAMKLYGNAMALRSLSGAHTSTPERYESVPDFGRPHWHMWNHPRKQ